MPLQHKNVRYRYKRIGPRKRIRLAFVGRPGKVAETTIFRKQNGWAKSKVMVRGSEGRRGTTRKL